VQRLFDAGGMGSGKMSSAFVAHGNWRQDCIAWLTPARAGALPKCAELDARIHALCNAVGRQMEAQRHMKLTGRHDTQLAVFPGDGSAFKRHSGAPLRARAAMRFVFAQLSAKARTPRAPAARPRAPTARPRRPPLRHTPRHRASVRHISHSRCPCVCPSARASSTDENAKRKRQTQTRKTSWGPAAS
jgi:hypothetical protein